LIGIRSISSSFVKVLGTCQQWAANPETGQKYDDMLFTGKVILAHMQEIPDYFTKPEED
jgi:hypothetical protein